MKKTLMILTMGLFLGTIGFTSTAMTNGVQTTKIAECKDKKECKKDCCKKKEGKAEACEIKECKKACCKKKTSSTSAKN